MRSGSPMERARRWAGILAGAAVFAGAFPAAARAQEAPTIRFHVGGEELLPIAYPERYRSDDDLEDDVEWARENSETLRAWWAGDGRTYLRRVTDLAGLAWEVEGIDVYLVRHWPVVSIERPLVLALDAVRASSGAMDLPEDEDTRVLLLAHQVLHWLLEPDAPGARDRVFGHPFLEPGDFALEAMVNWLTYEALTDLWGAERLSRATSTVLWRGYNPNHAFVTGELMRTWDLSANRTLREWLQAHPEGSDVFDVAERYRKEAIGVARRTGEDAAVDRGNVSGTAHGIDLGADFEGDVFVSWVDESSPAARAGLRQGDLVETIEGRPVEDLVEAQRRMNGSWRENEEINLSVLRDGREVFVTVER